MTVISDHTVGKTIRLSDGRALGYAEYGDPAGHPIIGLHGMPGSRWFMSIFDKETRNAGLRLIAPERPGYGLSQPSNKLSLIVYAQDIAELADALGLGGFIVMGVSGGGPYALACAHQLAERLKAAAVVSGIGSLIPPGSMRGMAAPNRINFILGRLSPAFSGFLLPKLLRSSISQLEKHAQAGTSPSPDLTPELIALLITDLSEAIRSGGQGIKYDMHNFWKPWGFRLQDVRKKVYLWHGEADNLAPAHLAHRVADQLPICESTFFPGEGHTDPFIKHLDILLSKLVGASEV